jgi:hypothetical protein
LASDSLRPSHPLRYRQSSAHAIGNIEQRWRSLAEELDAWRAVGEATAIDGR